MKKYDAVKAALAACRSEKDRLWFLKKASKRYATHNLGVFCRKVGASSDDLGKLLLDRSAQDGMRPESELIC